MRKLLILSAFGLTVAFLCLVPKAEAALSVVQVNATTSASASKITVPFVTTGGDLLVMFEGNGSSSSGNATPTDSAGQTWTFAASTSPSITGEVSIYYIANSLAVATTSCVYNFTVVNAPCAVYEISGAALTNPLDITSVTSTITNITTATSGVYTTTNANDIILFGARPSNNQTTWTAGAGFTLPANSTSTREGFEYQITSSLESGSSTSLAYTVASGYSSVLAAFKAASNIAVQPKPHDEIVTMDW